MQETPQRDNREVSREEIERRAFKIYVESGMEHGHDLEHWLAAEQELLGEETGGPSDPRRNDSGRREILGGFGLGRVVNKRAGFGRKMNWIQARVLSKYLEQLGHNR